MGVAVGGVVLLVGLVLVVVLAVVVDGRQFAWDDPDGRVSAGDRTMVSAQRGALVRVVWNGESTETLAEYEIPA